MAEILETTKLSQEHLFDLYEQMFGEIGTINVLQKTARLISEILNAERATIYITIKETQELKSVAIIGNVSQTIIIPINNASLAGYCALSKRSFVVPDAYGDLNHLDQNIKFDNSWDKKNSFRTRDVICVPVVFKGEVLGVVQAINSKRGLFNSSYILQLEDISRFIAYALYHARLYDELATLKGLEKEKAEFMRILVHELRSPLATSKMLVSSALFVSKENQEITPVLTKVNNRIDQLLLLVEDILYISKIKSGAPLGEIKVLDLVEETGGAFKQYYEEGKAKGLNMKIELPNYAVQVRIDVLGYRLIISNLLSNAIKYTSCGSIIITLVKKKNWATLKIKDTGMGIPKNDISSLFTEFFRASNARKSQIVGTGIGLTGVKELVGRFGGMLELETVEEKGSEFIVHLPVFTK